MIKRILFIACFMMLYTALKAQELIDKTEYYTFKTSDWKGDAAPNLIKMNLVQNPMTGAYLLRDNKGNPLNGRYHIIIHMHKYIVADISKGLFDGTYELYSFNGLSEKYNYKQGVYDGKQYLYSKNATYTYNKGTITHYIAYHHNKQLQEENHYIDGKLDGEVKKYNVNGRIISQKHYVNGALDGEVLEARSNGYTTLSNYKNDSLQGDYKETYANGNIAKSGTYGEKEKKTGLWAEHKENGEIKSEESYLNGLLHGEKKDYTDGMLYQSCEYANGKRNGKRMYWRGDAPYLWLSEEENYVDGRLDGLRKWYNERKILYQEATYKEGQKVKDKNYDMSTGTIRQETLYQDGRNIAQKVYNNKGVLQLLKLVNERGSLVDVKEYNTQGQVIKTNKTYKKTPAIKLIEDEWGIIDIME